MKTFDQIVSSLLTNITANTPFTNLNPSAAIRGILEVVGLAIAELYQLIKSVSGALFVQTATGGWLDLKAREVGVKRLVGQKARMWVKFYRDTPATGNITIPAGTCVRSRADASGLSYRFFTESEAILLTGTSEIYTTVIAEEVGTGYNVAEGTVTRFVSSIAQIPHVINEDNGAAGYLIQEGSNAETDAAFRERTITAWDSLGVGGNRTAYYNWCMSVEGVKAAMVLDDEPYGPGSVGLVILGEAGQPTPQLLADVEDYVRMRQPLGVARMVASGATITDVNLALTVMRFSNADRTTVENAVTAALEAYGDGLQLGESMVLSRMIAAVQAVDGVYSVDFTSPSTNVGAAPTEYLNVDSITITHQIKRRTYHDSAIDGGLGEAVSSIDPIDQSEWTI